MRRRRVVADLPKDDGLVWLDKRHGLITPEQMQAWAKASVDRPAFMGDTRPNWRDDKTYDMRRKR